MLDEYSKIEDPIAHTYMKISHLNEIIEGVPLRILSREARRPIGRGILIMKPLAHLSPQSTPVILSDIEDDRENDLQ